MDYSQAPLSMGFSRQEYGSKLAFPSPGDLPDPRIKPTSSALTGKSFTTEPPGKPSTYMCVYVYVCTYVYVCAYIYMCVYMCIHFFVAHKMLLIEMILFSIYDNPVVMGHDPPC